MDDEVEQWLTEGIARAKAGERERARELLLHVVERDERNAQAWLWISGVVESPEDRRVALENVLAIEPENQVPRSKRSLSKTKPPKFRYFQILCWSCPMSSLRRKGVPIAGSLSPSPTSTARSAGSR